MAWTLYWTVAPVADSSYAEDDTGAGYIKDGKNASGTALPAGTFGSIASPTSAGANTVDATSPPTTQLSAGTTYVISWTIWDGSAYGGGTANKVEQSAAFQTAVVATAADGASTASTLTGASTASATITQADGASAAQTLTGASAASATITAADGASVAGTLTGSAGTGASTITAAAGESVAGTLAGSSSAVATATAADGASVAGTLTGITGTGGSTIETAAGLTAAQVLAGSSICVSTIAAAAGVSVCGTLAPVGATPIRGLPTWYYTPGNIPMDAPAWLARELLSVSRATYGAAPIIQMQVQYAEPAKPRDGMVVLADGSTWNPGSGAGIYARIGGAWVQL